MRNKINLKEVVTALKNTAILKHLTVVLFVIPFILASCASTGGPDAHAPDWYKAFVEGEQDDSYVIKFYGRGSSESDAARQAAGVLFERLMELCDTQSAYSLTEDREDLETLIAGMIEDGSRAVDSFGSIKRREWVATSKGMNVYGLFRMERDAPRWLEERLAERYYGSDEILAEILASAAVLEKDGKLYSAAEELIRAAAYVFGRGLPLEKKRADEYIARAFELLKRIDIRISSVPERAFVNRRVEPFHLYCSVEEDAVADVEFLVQYQGRKRDGSPGQFERRLVSNETGIVEFFHPFIPFSGQAGVVFSAGSRDFRTSLSTLDENGLDVEALKEWSAANRFSHQLLVEAVDREISTGIVVLHADITGKSLELNDAASGILEELTQAGFNVSIMNLDPDEITEAGEDSFLRDLKAAYKGDYDRVLFGVVGINDFEARSESYRVATSGYLKMADVESGEILVSLERDKSVESRNDGLAVSASFRELGKAFAQDLISALD